MMLPSSLNLVKCLLAQLQSMPPWTVKVYLFIFFSEVCLNCGKLPCGLFSQLPEVASSHDAMETRQLCPWCHLMSLSLSQLQIESPKLWALIPAHNMGQKKIVKSWGPACCLVAIHPFISIQFLHVKTRTPCSPKISTSDCVSSSRISWVRLEKAFYMLGGMFHFSFYDICAAGVVGRIARIARVMFLAVKHAIFEKGLHLFADILPILFDLMWFVCAPVFHHILPYRALGSCSSSSWSTPKAKVKM